MKNDKNQNKALSQTSVSSNCSYCNRQIVKDLTSRDLGIVKKQCNECKNYEKK